jgi:CRP-like cAMP-binding protein
LAKNTDKRKPKSISFLGPQLHQPANEAQEEVPKNRRTLLGNRLFDLADETLLRNVEHLCEWRWVKRGDIIFSRQQIEKNIYFVVEGEFDNRHLRPDDTLADPTMNFGPGDFFGHGRAIDMEIRGKIPGPAWQTHYSKKPKDGPPSLAAPHITAVSSGLIATLTNKQFLNLLCEEPDILLPFLAFQHGTNEYYARLLANMRTLNSDQRIVEELLWLAECSSNDPNELIINEIPSQEFLAGSLGITRRTVVRIFNRLYKEGNIERHGRKLIITDTEALRESVFKGE